MNWTRKRTNPRRRRLLIIGLIFATFALATALLLFAMNQDLNHYYSLEQVAAGQAPRHQRGIRVGGMVARDSFRRAGESLTVSFAITDFRNPPLTVHYTGILPDLFREGQGVIVKGQLTEDGFQGEEVLAKHDENYQPPELKGLEHPNAQR